MKNEIYHILEDFPNYFPLIITFLINIIIFLLFKIIFHCSKLFFYLRTVVNFYEPFFPAHERDAKYYENTKKSEKK